MSANPNLFGHLAVHYKLVTPDQLAEATRRQAKDEHSRPLGEYLVEMGLVTPAHVAKLLEVQRGVLAKQAAERAAGAPAPPALTTPAPTPALPVVAAPGLGGAAGPARRVDRLLELAFREGASDLHLRSDEPALLRRGGELRALGEAPLSAAEVRALAEEMLGPRELERLDREGQVDFSATLGAVARFRGNAYRQQRGLDVVLRAIAAEAPSLEDLGLPSTLAKLTNYHQGLVLITGPAGCGKTSTHGGAAESGQRGAPRPHPHHRGPDRVPAPSEALRGQPAPGRARHRELRARAARGAARGPRRHRDRRAARPRDDLAGADRRRDRPLRARHAAHRQRHPHRRPHRRRLPAQPAGAGARDALRVAARGGLAAPGQPRRRQGAAARARDPARHPRGRQPDPRERRPSRSAR